MDSRDWSLFLPEELVLILFKFLRPGDILATSQTCRLWKKLGENDKLWEQICEEAGLPFSLTAANLSALERRSKKSSIAYSSWKENFLKPYKTAMKFQQEVPQVLSVELSHNVDQMKIFDDKIVTIYKNEVNVYCALSGRLIQELVGHTSDVKVIEIYKEFVISGSYDDLKMWDVNTGSCLATLLIHTVGVSRLQIHGTKVISGSDDGTLRIWDVQEQRCLRTLAGHSGHRVARLEFDGRLLISSREWPLLCQEYRIKVWDPQTGECLRTLRQQQYYYSFKLHGSHLLVHCSGLLIHESVKIWEVNTGVCLHTLAGFDGGYMNLLGDVLVSRSADHTIAKIWSLSTGTCLHTLAGHQRDNSDIHGIGINRKFVVTSSWDGRVILWDIKTGEFVKDLFMLGSGEIVVKMEMKQAKIVFIVYVHARRRRKAHTKLLVLNFDE